MPDLTVATSFLRFTPRGLWRTWRVSHRDSCLVGRRGEMCALSALWVGFGGVRVGLRDLSAVMVKHSPIRCIREPLEKRAH
jgi:hypothetical protein